MLKHNSTLQILNQTELCLNEKTIIAIELKNNELGGKIKKEFVGLRAKTCSYLKGNNDIDKKQQAQK